MGFEFEKGICEFVKWVFEYEKWIFEFEKRICEFVKEDFESIVKFHGFRSRDKVFFIEFFEFLFEFFVLKK